MILFRFLQIQAILIHYKIDNLLLKIIGARYLSIYWLKVFFPWRWFVKNRQPTPIEIRDAFIHLGPVFIKLGQSLSTRSDVLPPAIAVQMAHLQDRIPCFDTHIAIEIIEATFKGPINSVFKTFDPTPLAGASIAQVYSAQLHTGESVVIKIRRPGIEKKIKKDTQLMAFFAKMINTLPKLKRYKAIEIVAEFKKTLETELNFKHEAANASLLKRNFAHSPVLYIPKIYWDYSHAHLIVIERIEGIPISNIAALKEAKIDLKKLAERGVEIFFTQVFRDSFFHADMHPGNIFVCPKNPSNPQYIAVDFGIMGTLTPSDQSYLAQNFLAFFKRDYRKVAQLHMQAAWVNPQIRLNEFEAAIRTVCEPMFERPLKDISFAASLLALFQTAQSFDMRVQPQLLLLQKTLLNIEGLGKQLYPELNLWHSAQPFLEQWLKNHMGPSIRFAALLEKLQKQLPQWPQWLDKLLHSIL